jgi:hypothetical protein
VKLTPSMLRMLYEARAPESGGVLITYGSELLTARALRRRGLLTNAGPSPTGRGWAWRISAKGEQALKEMEAEVAARADEPETDVAAYGRGQ